MLALLLAGGCLHARGTPSEPVLLSFDLDGVRSVDEDALRDRLASRPSGRYAWSEVTRLDPDALALDQKRIAAFYKERGYYRAAVERVDVVPDGEGRVRVTLHVREGEPVRVRRVDVEGLDAAPEAREKARRLSLAPGAIFTWEAYDAARAELLGALQSTGWATSTVTQAARVSADEGAVDVTYRVEAGPRFRFGAVAVHGEEAVPEAKIASQAARVLTRGDWYDERLLELVQSRVFDLGVFGGVRVSRGTPDLALGNIPLDVNVQEAPFRTVRTGPGFGFEATRWEVVGQASWTHRNWLGGLRRLQLDARAGYAWLPDAFSPIREGAVGKLSADFRQPGVLFGDRVDFSTGIDLEKSLEQAYDSFSEKWRVGTPFRPAPRWTIVPSYNLELYQLKDYAGEGTRSLSQVQNCPDDFCILSYLEQRITWDGRDHPLVTTEGAYVSLSIQEGFPAGGQGYTYLRFMPEVRWFHALGRGTVLAMRAKFGALVPIDETGAAPVVALFMAGGPGSMRGYGADRLSPMVEEDGVWVPTGGNGLVEGSVEVRKPIAGSLIGALFLDVGNVSDASGKPTEWRTVLDPGLLQFAAGVGVRYRTPVGPLRADLAFRLPDDLSPGVAFEDRFPAVPGSSGHREPLVAIHVTLGEAF